MASQQNFRSAFNGFNREDVVRYLEYVNTKHTAQVNQLTSELEYYRQLAQQPPVMDTSAAAQAMAALADEKERSALLEKRCAALEQELAQAAQQQTNAQCQIMQELEAYRRAEQAERLARERAEQLYRQANGILADATVRVDEVAAEIGSMADQVVAQLAQLQGAVTGSKQALADAAATMCTISAEEA